ncbi:hypothetical protein [Micromonospora sp. NPDC048830]|uniref:hypothetical protein n=1 Tax=Micromonospora sp. NPDC048830 TaxID=3364257 RepID=UPI00371E2ACF
MMFEIYPPAEPLEIPGGGTGPLSGFFVPFEARETYLRVIALWRDNAPLVGHAPTFELKSGRDGELTAVDAEGKTVGIRGAGDSFVASAHCQRLPGDTYLITISDIDEEAGPWYLRIRNNDPEPLRFVWVGSQRESDTLQPWMALDVPGAEQTPGTLSLLSDGPPTEVRVRNQGTAPLVINDEPGTQLDAGRSPAVLVSRPAPIAPHDVGQLTIQCGTVSSAVTEFEHVFDANDPRVEHRTLRFQTLPISAGTPLGGQESESFCRWCGRCPEYLPPSPPGLPGGPCRRAGCADPAAAHFDVPPDLGSFGAAGLGQ